MSKGEGLRIGSCFRGFPCRSCRALLCSQDCCCYPPALLPRRHRCRWRPSPVASRMQALPAMRSVTRRGSRRTSSPVPSKRARPRLLRKRSWLRVPTRALHPAVFQKSSSLMQPMRARGSASHDHCWPFSRMQTRVPSATSCRSTGRLRPTSPMSGRKRLWQRPRRSWF